MATRSKSKSGIPAWAIAKKQAALRGLTQFAYNSVGNAAPPVPQFGAQRLAQNNRIDRGLNAASGASGANDSGTSRMYLDIMARRARDAAIAGRAPIDDARETRDRGPTYLERIAIEKARNPETYRYDPLASATPGAPPLTGGFGEYFQPEVPGMGGVTMGDADRELAMQQARVSPSRFNYRGDPRVGMAPGSIPENAPPAQMGRIAATNNPVREPLSTRDEFSAELAGLHIPPDTSQQIAGAPFSLPPLMVQGAAAQGSSEFPPQQMGRPPTAQIPPMPGRPQQLAGTSAGWSQQPDQTALAQQQAPLYARQPVQGMGMPTATQSPTGYSPFTPAPQPTPSSVPVPSFLAQNEPPPSPLIGSRMGNTQFGPPIPPAPIAGMGMPTGLAAQLSPTQIASRIAGVFQSPPTMDPRRQVPPAPYSVAAGLRPDVFSLADSTLSNENRVDAAGTNLPSPDLIAQPPIPAPAAPQIPQAAPQQVFTAPKPHPRPAQPQDAQMMATAPIPRPRPVGPLDTASIAPLLSFVSQPPPSTTAPMPSAAQPRVHSSNYQPRNQKGQFTSFVQRVFGNPVNRARQLTTLTGNAPTGSR